RLRWRTRPCHSGIPREQVALLVWRESFANATPERLCPMDFHIRPEISCKRCRTSSGIASKRLGTCVSQFVVELIEMALNSAGSISYCAVASATATQIAMSGTGTVSAAAPSINSCVKSLRIIVAPPIWSAAFRAIQNSVTNDTAFYRKELQSTAQTVISPSTHTLDSSLCIQITLIVGYLVRNNISNNCSATVLYLRLRLGIQVEPHFRPVRPRPIGAQQHDQVTHLQKRQTTLAAQRC